MSRDKPSDCANSDLKPLSERLGALLTTLDGRSDVPINFITQCQQMKESMDAIHWLDADSLPRFECAVDELEAEASKWAK